MVFVYYTRQRPSAIKTPQSSEAVWFVEYDSPLSRLKGQSGKSTGGKKNQKTLYNQINSTVMRSRFEINKKKKNNRTIEFGSFTVKLSKKKKWFLLKKFKLHNLILLSFGRSVRRFINGKRAYELFYILLRNTAGPARRRRSGHILHYYCYYYFVPHEHGYCCFY